MIAALVLVVATLGGLELGRLGLAWRRAAVRKARALQIAARARDLVAAPGEADPSVLPPWRVLGAILVPPAVLLGVALEVVHVAHAEVPSLGPVAVLPLLVLPVAATVGHRVARGRWGPAR